ARELSALAVSRLKAEGRYAVSGVDGLYLRIARRSRAWGLIYMLIDYIKFCKGGFCF
ncbi:hypothetical protein GXW28_004863, partial [Salmonella enterica]|nr:hypothetical protein [Salmonella enterica]